MKLTVGKRIYLGFGVVLLFLVAVGLLAYFGVGGIVTNASEVIVGNQLDGNMAQKEVDHLNWANQVSALLTDDSVTDLNVQLDPTQCAFGKWLYSDDRRAAEQRVPSIAPLLKDIEQYHSDLHASAGEIGDVFQQPHPGLALMLSDRWADHVAWAGQCASRLANEGGGLYSYQSLTRNAVDQAYSIITACAENESLGDVDARKEEAKRLVREMRYGPDHNDYFWINDTQPTMIMHATQPELEGTDLSQTSDTHGNRMFAQMVRECEANGSGFVVYYWNQPGHNEPVPKISYVKLYKPWGWIVGTGVFLDAENHHLIARAAEFAAGAPFVLGVQTDPELCAFGQFLADPETIKLCREFPELKQALDACKEPHNRLHRSALKIQEHVTNNRFAEAIHVYEAETQASLNEVKAHFMEAIQAENTLQEAASAANTIFARKTKPNLEKVQELLNEVRHEVSENVMTDEAMLAAAAGTQRNVMVTGALAIIIGSLLAFFIARSLIKALVRLIVQLDDGAAQVNDAAGQVSGASQQLAEGASEQASSLEETSSALEQLAAMTKTNAENAGEANRLATEAQQAANEGDQTMGQLNTAMTGINESSDKISKIIKVIEEIAFQTNLLALNAAVEAARAGEHGKGFAVVAEEVRNLAMRAASAAGETTQLIEDSVTRAREGGAVAEQVGQGLTRITQSVAQVTQLIDGIARASNEQSSGINEINEAVSQMDKVTQSNAGSAEEAASAAEELSAQARTVKSMVDELVALTGGSASKQTAARADQSSPRAHPQRPQGQHPPHTPTHEPVGAGTSGQADGGNLSDF